jgi:ABC-type transporter Mla maintaining outer membrane lipid asymmetry ATPase subunit MlaF
MAIRQGNGEVHVVRATREKAREAEFIMLQGGLVIFEGDAEALRTSADPYIRSFLS